ncbi:unnamed protein product, partial [Amoebophrya sp. A25]|eukprot:GSA25T00012862001.1
MLDETRMQMTRENVRRIFGDEPKDRTVVKDPEIMRQLLMVAKGHVKSMQGAYDFDSDYMHQLRTDHAHERHLVVRFSEKSDEEARDEPARMEKKEVRSFLVPAGEDLSWMSQEIELASTATPDWINASPSSSMDMSRSPEEDESPEEKAAANKKRKPASTSEIAAETTTTAMKKGATTTTTRITTRAGSKSMARGATCMKKEAPVPKARSQSVSVRPKVRAKASSAHSCSAHLDQEKPTAIDDSFARLAARRLAASRKSASVAEEQALQKDEPGDEEKARRRDNPFLYQVIHGLLDDDYDPAVGKSATSIER